MPHFTERQFFARWVFVVLTLSTILPIMLIYSLPVKPEEALAFNWTMIFVIVLPILLLLTLGVMQTEVHNDELLVTFGLLRLIKYHFPYSDIHSVAVRTYSPLMEYGGWGIRGLGKKRALNMRGDRGVQLEITRKGKPVSMLIGSQRPEELAQAISAQM